MEHIVVAIISLGAFCLVVILVVITYYCIKSKMCCCQKNKAKAIDEDKTTKEALLGMTKDDECDFQLPEKVYSSVDEEYNEQYDELFDDFSYVPNYKSSDQYITDDILLAGNGDDVLGELPLPKSYTTVKSNTYSSISPDSQYDSGELSGRQKIKKDTYIDGCQLKLSVMFSKADMFLMMTIMEVSGMPTKDFGGYQFIRVTIALLPEKKYHSTTKVQEVMGEEAVLFGDSFYFSNVTYESLFRTAFRFRLYSKNKRGREICTGEIFMQMADNLFSHSRKSFQFVTNKPFERKRKVFR